MGGTPASWGRQVKIRAQGNPEGITLNIRPKRGLAGHRHIVDALLHVLIIDVHHLPREGHM